MVLCALRPMFALLVLALCVSVGLQSRSAYASGTVLQRAASLTQQDTLPAPQSTYGDAERNESALNGLASYVLCAGLLFTVVAVLGLHACRRTADPYPMRRYRRRL